VYEWEQSLEEVNIFIKPPPGVTARLLDVNITVNHLSVGIKGNPPYINVRSCFSATRAATLIDSNRRMCCDACFGTLQEDLGSDVIAKDSFWMMGVCGLERRCGGIVAITFLRDASQRMASFT
jgi:hypothetical protein